jgi:hypothetical protein
MAHRKGETVYLTVIPDIKLGCKFVWKDITDTVGNTNTVEFKLGYDQCLAEYKAKAAFDSYWENSMKTYNRTMIIAIGRQRLIEFAKAGSLEVMASIPTSRQSLSQVTS